ncbi:MAG: peptide deformylase [Coriobacteriia bacterium]|nr:peptide deformylase [Coriobacteriia bacterium]
MDILSHPNPALKQRAQDIDPTTDAGLMPLIKAMAKAMYDGPGIGLAATQVGVQKRVIVFDLDDGLIALCNPTIAETSAETVLEDEGCLSLPGITVPVERPVHCVCEAVDLRGNPFRMEAEGLLARLLQHEVDHLDGLLIIDRATPDERRAALRRYREENEKP